MAAPFQVGWCSWYQYFHDVTEADIVANLALADRWPFDVFQIDDGYQAAIGDWLETNDRFPSDLAGLAASIGATGRTPGLWLAPFLVAPDSEVARRHPDWIARHLVDGVDTGPAAHLVEPAVGRRRGRIHVRARHHPSRGGRPTSRRWPPPWSTPASPT